MVSSDGDTRSNGSVSHAGKSSTSLGAEELRRGRAPGARPRRPVGTATSSGRRVVAPASAATNSARAASGTATTGCAGDHRAQRRLLGEERGRAAARGAAGFGHRLTDATKAGCHAAPGVSTIRAVDSLPVLPRLSGKTRNEPNVTRRDRGSVS